MNAIANRRPLSQHELERLCTNNSENPAFVRGVLDAHEEHGGRVPAELDKRYPRSTLGSFFDFADMFKR